MKEIIIGTTPTITYKFKIVSVADIVTAILTIKQSTGIIVQKTLTDAEVGEDTLSWILSQQETFSIGQKSATMMINWKTAGGIRGASEITKIIGTTNHVMEVI